MTLSLTQVAAYSRSDYAYAVWGDGTFLYLANGHGGVDVFSFDAHTKTLTLCGSYNPTPACVDVYTDDTYLYVAGHSGGVYLLTVAADGSLTYEWTVAAAGDYQLGVWGETRSGHDYWYLASYDAGLQVYETNGDGSVTLKDADTTGELARGVHGDGTFIYVANGTSGLSVFAINESTGALTHKDSYSCGGGHARRVWTDGTFVYVGANNQGFYVFSVDGSGNITLCDSFLSDDPTNDEAWGVWAGGGYLYGVYRKHAVCVFSVDGSGNLTVVEENTGLYRTRGVWSDGEFVYFAMGDTARGCEVWTGPGIHPFQAPWALGVNQHLGLGLGV